VEFHIDIEKINRDFESLHPRDILQWTWANFAPSVVASSSFQSQSVVLLYLLSQVTPDVPVFFIDTGYHFPETLEYRDKLVQELGLNIQILRPLVRNLERSTGALYIDNPDRCCYVNKVQPLKEALTKYTAWITGIRRDQTKHRSRTKIISYLGKDLVKIAPLANWTSKQINDFIEKHGLSRHPLEVKGYRSIGCAPCTKPVEDGKDERAGRWPGSDKTECGLHLIGETSREEENRVVSEVVIETFWETTK
jgi:phosphoadenosine phosphosulfate reductase